VVGGGGRFKLRSIDGAGKHAATLERDTAWIYDLDGAGVVYSLACGDVDGIALHPSGRHLLIADDDQIKILGRDGLQHHISDVLGAALSPDGKRLVVVEKQTRSRLVVVDVFADQDRLVLGRRGSVSAGVSIYHDPKLRFSPSGNRVLLYHSNVAYWVDLGTGRTGTAGTGVTAGGGFLSDESRIVFADHVRGDASIVHDVAGWLGRFAVLGGELVGIAPLGFYGALADGAASGPSPYVRPDVVRWRMTGTGDSPLDADGMRLLDEVAARRAAWQPYVHHLTADITLDRLVDLNRGLSHLTPAIVAIATTYVGDPPRFGPMQIGWTALERAAKQVAAMSREQRESLFQTMIARIVEAKG
jgi:hypothetical protein